MAARRSTFATFRSLRGGHRRALLAVSLTVCVLLPVGAQAQIKVRKADCLMKADGKTYIDGVCEFLTDARSYGIGGFRLANYDNGHLRHGVVVSVTSPGRGSASWNETPGGRLEQGASEPVTLDGACWTGARSRICAWKVGEGRPGFADTPAASQPDPGATRAADCTLEVGGEIRLDGPCQFRPETGQDGTRGFEVRSYTTGNLDYVAQLVRDPREPSKATAYWNERPGTLRATDFLGTLVPNGPCWESANARLCVWQPGQPRGAWDRRAERVESQAASPPPAKAAPVPRGAAEGADPTPGQVLTLTFQGRCESLVIDGEDIGSSCASSAKNKSTTGSSQAEFVFGTVDGREVTFLASSKGWVENGILHQPIDQVMYEERGRSNLLKAKGVCVMPNPMGGPIIIACNAQSTNSAYSARFRTNGGKPALSQSNPG